MLSIKGEVRQKKKAPRLLAATHGAQTHSSFCRLSHPSGIFHKHAVIIAGRGQRGEAGGCRASSFTVF